MNKFYYIEVPLDNYLDKVIEKDEVAKIICDIKKSATNNWVALASGTYDLGHAEHKRFLTSIKNFLLREKGKESKLVLAMDSDEWVKKRKGERRPILTFKQRSIDMSYLEAVDYIVKHDGNNTSLIEELKPHLFIMSRATKEEQPTDRITDFEAVGRIGGIVGVMDGGGDLGLSTTKIIERITESYVLQPS